MQWLSMIRRWQCPFRITHVVPLIVWVALVLAIELIVYSNRHGTAYTPDSWSYYELSNSMFTDFSSIHTIRQFQVPGWYGSSFPPLWPFVIAVTRSVTGLEVAAGVLAAGLAVLASAVVIDQVVWRLIGVRGCGPVIMLGMLTFAPFQAEVAGARSIPFALLLFSLLVWLLGSRSTSRLWAPGLGLALGALVMTRFDWLLLALLIPVLIFKSPRVQWKEVFSAYVALIAGMSIWIVHSLLRFGTVFVADNSGIAKSTKARLISDYVVADTTLFDDPVAWIERIASNVAKTVSAVQHAATEIRPSLLVIVGVFGLAVLWNALESSQMDSLPSSEFSMFQSGERTMVILGCALLVYSVTPSLLLAYLDTRYWSLLAVAVLGFVLVGLLATHVGRMRSGFILGASSIVLLFTGVAPPLAATTPPVAQDSVEIARLEDCVGKHTVMISTSSFFAYKAGATTGMRVVPTPSNLATLSDSELKSFVDNYPFDYLYAASDGDAQFVDAFAERINASGLGSFEPQPCAEGLLEKSD